MRHKKWILTFASINLLSVSYAMEQSKKIVGDYYHKHSQVQLSNGQKLLQEYVGDLKDYRRVSDWGCGVGALLENLAKQYPETLFHGFDISASMIEQARKQCAYLKNISFEQFDVAGHYNYINPCNNLAMCFSTLHWIENQQQVLANIANSLIDGGKMIISMAGDDNKEANPFIKAWMSVAKKDAWQCYLGNQEKAPYYPLSLSAMDTLLSHAKLEVLELKLINNQRQFENITRLKEWAQGWAYAIPVLNKIPADKREEFVDELLDNYYDNQICWNPDGSLSYNYILLVCLAQKKDEKNE